MMGHRETEAESKVRGQKPTRRYAIFVGGGLVRTKEPRGRYVDGEAFKWNPNRRAVTATINFAIKVGMFRTE